MVDVFNQCPSGGGACEGLDNFWRSLSNLTLNVTLPKSPPTYVPATGEDAGCNNAFESQTHRSTWSVIRDPCSSR